MKAALPSAASDGNGVGAPRIVFPVAVPISPDLSADAAGTAPKKLTNFSIRFSRVQIFQ